MEKLKSRKFWFALIGAILPVINEHFGLKIPIESVMVVIAYILGQSFVDAKK
jgi:uncharacterized membrane protein